MQSTDNKIMAAFEGMALAARQHQSDSVLLQHALMAASTIAEGMPGDEARKLEQLIDACLVATQRTLDSLASSRGELHETRMEIGMLIQTWPGLPHGNGGEK